MCRLWDYPVRRMWIDGKVAAHFSFLEELVFGGLLLSVVPAVLARFGELEPVQVNALRLSLYFVSVMGFGFSHSRRYAWRYRYDILGRRWTRGIRVQDATLGDWVYFAFLGAAFRWGYLRALTGIEALLIALIVHAFYNEILARSGALPLAMILFQSPGDQDSSNS